MSLIDNIVPYTLTWTDDLTKELDTYPPGVVGIASAFLGRYREIDSCLNLVHLPPGTIKQWCLGVDPSHHFNEMCRTVISNPTFQWIWILGDDHVFTTDLWYRLYKHNLDIVVPLCLRRSGFTPILNNGSDG